jgi:hypothetical protein
MIIDCWEYASRFLVSICARLLPAAFGSRARTSAKSVGGAIGLGVSNAHRQEIGNVNDDKNCTFRCNYSRNRILGLCRHKASRQPEIVADMSNDASYAEPLFEVFAKRVIGVQIGAAGDGTNFERRILKNGVIPVYHLGRTFLFDLLLPERGTEVKARTPLP